MNNTLDFQKDLTLRWFSKTKSKFHKKYKELNEVFFLNQEKYTSKTC